MTAMHIYGGTSLLVRYYTLSILSSRGNWIFSKFGVRENLLKLEEYLLT